MNPSSHTSGPASVGSAYYKPTAPRNTAASQETLLEYLGIKPTPPNASEGYQGVPYMVDESRKLPPPGYGPHYKNNDKILNNGYTTHTPYGTMKDGEYPTEKQQGDVPFIECRVEIQDGEDVCAQKDQAHRYDLGVKEEPLELFASSDNNGYTSSATYNPFSSDDNSSSYTSSNSAIYANGMKNGSTVDLHRNRCYDMANSEAFNRHPHSVHNLQPLQQEQPKLEDLTHQHQDHKPSEAPGWEHSIFEEYGTGESKLEYHHLHNAVPGPVSAEVTAKRLHRTARKIRKEYRRLKRENMTEEEVRAQKSLMAALGRMRRQLRQESMSEDELMAHRAAAAEAQRELRRRARESMTEEELAEHRAMVAAAQRELRRRARESMTEEEVRQHKYDVAAAQKELRRRAQERMSEDELKAYRAKIAAQQRELRRRQRETMNEEQLREHKSAVAAAQRELRRRARDKMSEEELKARRAAVAAAQRELRRQARQKMTPQQIREQKAAVAAAQREARRRERDRMTEEELRAKRAAIAEARRDCRKREREKMTEEELKAHRAAIASAAAARRHRRQLHGDTIPKEEEPSQDTMDSYRVQLDDLSSLDQAPSTTSESYQIREHLSRAEQIMQQQQQQQQQVNSYPHPHSSMSRLDQHLQQPSDNYHLHLENLRADQHLHHPHDSYHRHEQHLHRAVDPYQFPLSSLARVDHHHHHPSSQQPAWMSDPRLQSMVSHLPLAVKEPNAGDA